MPWLMSAAVLSGLYQFDGDDDCSEFDGAVTVEVSVNRARKPSTSKTDSKRACFCRALTLPESAAARLPNLSHASLFPGPVSVTSAWFFLSNLCYLLFIKSALPDE